MSAQDALREALRDIVGPAVRKAGFKGSGNTWRCFNPAGDCAVVNVQSSSFSTAKELHCVINLAVAPVPWLDWLDASLGSRPKAISESLGLYRHRLHPTGSPANTDVWWEVRRDRDAQAAAEDMVVRLQTAGLPVLLKLLDRDEMLAAVRRQDLGDFRGPGYDVFFSKAEAILIADLGVTPRLEELLEYVTSNSIPSQRENAARFADWVLRRAGTLGLDGA